MSGGIAALLDDIAALAKAAAASADDVAAATAKASAKAAGVVIDDTAVTPQYVTGVHPSRELPMIWKIAKGSLINKLVIILPIALLLSQFLPAALTPLLMLGGTYLCFEGMEKVWEKISHRDGPGHGHSHDTADRVGGTQDEDSLVKSAIFTDLILSSEIMVISLNEVAGQPLGRRTVILIFVALTITLAVYGLVGALVKIDDIGIRLSRSSSKTVAAFGRGLFKSMPIVLSIIGIIGTLAMLWVGGHIVLVGLKDLGLHAPYELTHHLELMVPAVFFAWLVNTACSLVFGVIVGTVVLLIAHVIPWPAKNVGTSASVAPHASSNSAPDSPQEKSCKTDVELALDHLENENLGGQTKPEATPVRRAAAGALTPGGILTKGIEVPRK